MGLSTKKKDLEKDEELERLIKKCQEFNFQNNSVYIENIAYSKPSQEFLIWINNVESYIENN